MVDERGCDVPHGTAGEVVVRGPNVFFEYWGNEAATSEALRNGWYFTGDIGTRDVDGYFVIHDRKKNLIISGGENIYPAEIETILMECSKIAEACVVGRTDERWGEAVVAVVVLQPGARMSEADVLALLQDRIARFKHPREIRFADRLPRTALGKVMRADLVKAISTTAAA